MQASKKYSRLQLLSATLILVGNQVANAAEVAVWQHNPIPIQLKTGVERRIDFPEPIVEIDAPQELAQQSRILLKPDGKLFWLPNADIEKTRIMVTSATGNIYLFDVTANTEGREDILQIVDPAINGGYVPSSNSNVPQTITSDSEGGDSIPAMAATSAPINARPEDNLPLGLPDFLKTNHATTATASSRSTNTTGGSESVAADIGYIEMARFAMSHFTGPERLIPDYPASQVGVKPITRPWLRLLGHRVRTKPLAQWQMNGKFVTAIAVRNQDHTPINWDPRALRGNFEFSAALHSAIAPAGRIGDESLWVVISSVPFNQAVGVEGQP